MLAFSCTNLFGYMFNLASTCVRGIVHGCTLVRHGLLEIVSLSLLCIPVCRMRYLRCTLKPKQQVQHYCVNNELGFGKLLQPNDLFVLVFGHLFDHKQMSYMSWGCSQDVQAGEGIVLDVCVKPKRTVNRILQ